MRIWEKYFLKETLKIFCLVIFGFYGLYALIDYANHSSSFQYFHSWFKWGELFLYYAYEFSNRLDIILPFALLIAVIRTTSQLTLNLELVALMTSGISIKRLMRPFLIVGLFAILTIYINSEIVQPIALKNLRHMQDLYSSKKKEKTRSRSVEHIALKDRTTFIFQSYDSANNRFFDAYWVKSFDDVYRIKYLYPSDPVPKGFYVEHLTRNTKGELAVAAAANKMTFPDLHFNKKILIETITPDNERSLSELFRRTSLENESNEKQARERSVFYRKLIVPWLCLLAVIGPIPFCIRYNRHLPMFFIYAFGIFSLIACYLLLDAVTVLGKRQVLTPAMAILPPFALIFGLFSYRYSKL